VKPFEDNDIFEKLQSLDFSFDKNGNHI